MSENARQLGEQARWPIAAMIGFSMCAGVGILGHEWYKTKTLGSEQKLQAIACTIRENVRESEKSLAQDFLEEEEVIATEFFKKPAIWKRLVLGWILINVTRLFLPFLQPFWLFQSSSFRL